MVARFALCFAAALSSAGCAAPPPPPVVQMLPDQCPAGWPVDPTSPQVGRALITFKNEFSGTFGLQRVVIGLDDLSLCWRTMSSDPGAPYLDASQLPSISVPLIEGEHKITIYAQFQGITSGGVDLRGYRFTASSAHVFDVERAKLTEVVAMLYEKGGPGTPPEDRPAIRYSDRQAGAVP